GGVARRGARGAQGDRAGEGRPDGEGTAVRAGGLCASPQGKPDLRSPAQGRRRGVACHFGVWPRRGLTPAFRANVEKLRFELPGSDPLRGQTPQNGRVRSKKTPTATRINPIRKWASWRAPVGLRRVIVPRIIEKPPDGNIPNRKRAAPTR